MADTVVKKTRRRAMGPRQVKPLYLLVEGEQAPKILAVTKEPFPIMVRAQNDGLRVQYVDLVPYLPSKSKNVAA